MSDHSFHCQHRHGGIPQQDKEGGRPLVPCLRCQEASTSQRVSSLAAFQHQGAVCYALPERGEWFSKESDLHHAYLFRAYIFYLYIYCFRSLIPCRKFWSPYWARQHQPQEQHYSLWPQYQSVQRFHVSERWYSASAWHFKVCAHVDACSCTWGAV